MYVRGASELGWALLCDRHGCGVFVWRWRWLGYRRTGDPHRPGLVGVGVGCLVVRYEASLALCPLPSGYRLTFGSGATCLDSGRSQDETSDGHDALDARSRCPIPVWRRTTCGVRGDPTRD